MDELLTLEAISAQTAVSVRRLREWCATGRLKNEHDAGKWVIPRSEVEQVAALAASSRNPLDKDRPPVALVVPAEVAPRNLADEVAHRLGPRPTSVAMSTLAIDGQDYGVAVWKDGHAGGLPQLVRLAEEVGGQLLAAAARDRPELREGPHWHPCRVPS